MILTIKTQEPDALRSIQYSGKGTTDNHTFLYDYVQLSISFDFFNWLLLIKCFLWWFIQDMKIATLQKKYITHLVFFIECIYNTNLSKWFFTSHHFPIAPLGTVWCQMERYGFNDLSPRFVHSPVSVTERPDHVAITVGKTSIRGVSVEHSVAFGRLSTKGKDKNFVQEQHDQSKFLRGKLG